MADGDFGYGRDSTGGSIPLQEVERGKFHRGIRLCEKRSPELACKPVDAPWLTSGSLACCNVKAADGITEVSILLVVLGAFPSDRKLVRCAGFPMLLLADRAEIAVAFEKSLYPAPPREFTFHAYPDTRVTRGPDPTSPTDPTYSTHPDDSRLTDSAQLVGRRMTIARPHLGQVYGFSWSTGP